MTRSNASSSFPQALTWLDNAIGRPPAAPDPKKPAFWTGERLTSPGLCLTKGTGAGTDTDTDTGTDAGTASSLARIEFGSISLDDADSFDDEDMPDGWADALARFVDQSRLPALERLELAAYLRLDGLDPEELARRIAAPSR